MIDPRTLLSGSQVSQYRKEDLVSGISRHRDITQSRKRSSIWKRLIVNICIRTLGSSFMYPRVWFRDLSPMYDCFFR